MVLRPIPSFWAASIRRPLVVNKAALIILDSKGHSDVWDVLTRRFESRLIQTALANTHGRRIEAAHKLGIGRNTITRKIQDLNLD